MYLDVDRVRESEFLLCELKYRRLKDIAERMSNGKYRMLANVLPSVGGIYCFWWTTGIDTLLQSEINRVINFVGPNGRLIEIEFTDEWFKGIEKNGLIPLYVGKTADSLLKRIGLHLQLGTERSLTIGTEALFERRKTTSNQLRDRIDRLFLHNKDTRSLILNNIGLSYVELNGDIESVNRFYIEDRIIGNWFPIFNIDIER